MTDEAKRCVETCREWYQVFVNFGRGDERSVNELLAVADLIESLSAELEQVKDERDGLLKQLRGDCGICAHWQECVDSDFACCHSYPNCWQWRGVQEE